MICPLCENGFDRNSMSPLPLITRMERGKDGLPKNSESKNICADCESLARQIMREKYGIEFSKDYVEIDVKL